MAHSQGSRHSRRSRSPSFLPTKATVSMPFNLNNQCKSPKVLKSSAARPGVGGLGPMKKADREGRKEMVAESGVPVVVGSSL